MSYRKLDERGKSLPKPGRMTRKPAVRIENGQEYYD